MTNLVYISTMLPAYKEKLQADLSETELLIINLMHFIEIYEYDDRKGLEMMERIREARVQSHIVKNGKRSIIARIDFSQPIWQWEQNTLTSLA